MNANPDLGLISVPSHHSVQQTLDRLTGLLAARGIELFALIDHDGGAARAGLRMRPTKLVICGNPKAGTPLMIAAPTVAIDLPLKVLVWEDADGQTWVSYNSPAYLMSRHGVPQELAPNIAGLGAIAARAAE